MLPYQGNVSPVLQTHMQYLQQPECAGWAFRYADVSGRNTLDLWQMKTSASMLAPFPEAMWKLHDWALHEAGECIQV